MASTYLTVAIPYVNAAPHLGYAYELVLGDIAARARRSSLGGEVRFLGGTDDYSLKNVLAADAAGVPTGEFVAAHAGRFAALGEPLAISFDDFIQTSSDPRHPPAVTRLWERVAERGDLRNSQYLWMRILAGHAAASLSCSLGRSTITPFSKVAPARTRATRWGALTARHRSWAASISL